MCVRGLKCLTVSPLCALKPDQGLGFNMCCLLLQFSVSISLTLCLPEAKHLEQLLNLYSCEPLCELTLTAIYRKQQGLGCDVYNIEYNNDIVVGIVGSCDKKNQYTHTHFSSVAISPFRILINIFTRLQKRSVVALCDLICTRPLEKYVNFSVSLQDMGCLLFTISGTFQETIVHFSV